MQGAEQQWEYGRVAIALQPSGGNQTWVVIGASSDNQAWVVVGAGGGITAPHSAEPHNLLDNFLEVLGKEGWELVGVIDTVTPARGPNLLFKRARRQES